MAVSLRTTVLISIIFLAKVLSACASQTPETTFPEVTIPGSQVRQIKSTATGRDYDIYIRLPEEYTQKPSLTFPVLYVLDGQWDFKMLDSIYGGLHYDGFVPAMIIVGITYSGDNADYEALRAMDYTPVSDPNFSGSGDAPKFLAFLKEQLFPYIESNFRANPSRRILMGSSFGGTFSLYTMFTEPTLFWGYIISSPAVPFGDRFAFQQEAEYASSHEDLPVRLFLSVGEAEHFRWPVEEFMRILRERNYPGLKMKTLTVESAGHSSNQSESYNRGLRFIIMGK